MKFKNLVDYRRKFNKDSKHKNIEAPYWIKLKLKCKSVRDEVKSRKRIHPVIPKTSKRFGRNNNLRAGVRLSR
jgi:hypothetical protein